MRHPQDFLNALNEELDIKVLSSIPTSQDEGFEIDLLALNQKDNLSFGNICETDKLRHNAFNELIKGLFSKKPQPQVFTEERQEAKTVLGSLDYNQLAANPVINKALVEKGIKKRI